MRYLFACCFLFVVASATAQNDTLGKIQKESLGFVEEQASFPGGETAMAAFIQKRVKYPKRCRRNNMEGMVVLKFIVNKDGTIGTITPLKEVAEAPEFTMEAIRVVKSMPNWIPGKINDRVVRSEVILPVSFRLKTKKK